MNQRSLESILRIAALALATCSGLGCGGPTYKRTYPEPQVEEMLAHLGQRTQQIASFRATSKMDYWIGKKRVRGTVLLMGKWGAHIRFNALSPTGGNVAADLACDGLAFKYIDYNANCQLTGVCDATAVAQLLRARLAPDDFLTFAIGATPVLNDAQGALRWDVDTGTEVIELVARDGSASQKIVLDGRERHWDVLESTLRDGDGEIEWTVQNKRFRSVTAPDNTTWRLAGRTKLVQPKEKADLIIYWEEQVLNPELGPIKFHMEIPPGLEMCR